MNKYKIPLVMILLFTGLKVLSAGQWPCVRGNQEGQASIKYSGGSPINEWHYIYKSGRRYQMGLAVWSSPALAVVGGRPMAFIGGYDQTLHALDLIEKKALWRKISNGEIASAPAVGSVDGTDVVFWGSSDRTVYAFKAFSGQKLWTKELLEASNTLGKVHISSPFLAGGKVYISCFAYDKSLPRNQQKGWLYCLDMKYGTIIWKLSVCSGMLSSPVGFEFNGKLMVAVAARRGLLQCFDVSGTRPHRVWKFQMPHEVMGSPVISKGRKPVLFLGSKYGNLIAIDAGSGKEIWQKMAGNWIDNTACLGEVNGEKVVFAGSHDYNLYAFRASDGEML
jgi:outer membrane protein assembly factor BamB